VDWWRTAVVYHIYPRSFADGNADGTGDLLGVLSRLPYLRRLGVDAVWLSPFYTSPMADGGYDVADYRDVDSRFGTLSDFGNLASAVHAEGMRLIVDIVPNHTSAEHPWFRKALSSPPGSAARQRYIFREGRGPRGDLPPSDWQSHFGGSAWERVADGQWYLHLFAPEQPDLNWDSPEVRRYFLDTLRWWADLGVDGFRVDVAHALAKDLSEPLRSQPHLDSNLPLDGSDPLYDRNEVHEIYRSWRAVFDEYQPPVMAVAETWTPTSSRTYLYARREELGQVFDFSLLKSRWDGESYRRVIQRSLEDHHRHADDGGGLTWVLSNHDVPRHASRLALPTGVDVEAWLLSGGRHPRIAPDLSRRRARAAALLLLALPGSAYVYQGEELGLPEVADLPVECLQDPVWFRTKGALRGRDGCRVPLPWTRAGSSFGFGDGHAWLPQPSWFADYSVEVQERDVGSTLNLYRTAIALRRSLLTTDSTVEWCDGQPDLLHFRRTNGWECVVNFGDRPRDLPPGEVLLGSEPLVPDDRRVAPDVAVWMMNA
jgi:alpha-glucosidase